MVGRGELTDKAWAQLALLLPGNQRRGGRWRDHRTVINGISWKLRTGAPWRDLPERYGPWQTCYDRSRGGLTTKIHLGCDGRGRPLGVVLTPGQRHDSTQLEPVLDAIRVPRPCGRGRPRKRPDHVVGDKAYSYPRCRLLLRRRGIPHTIPQRSDQRARRAGRPGRPLGFDRESYRGRNVVERCFNRLKQFRAVATRYDKRAVNYRTMVVIASLLIWLEG